MDTQGEETDWNLSEGDGFSVVAVGFVPPRAGLGGVLIDAQCVQPEHLLRTGNCWG